MPKNISQQKVFTNVTKTPKSIMDFKLKDKLDDFVENHFGKKYIVDTYTIVNSNTNVLTKITDIKIKVFIVKKIQGHGIILIKLFLCLLKLPQLILKFHIFYKIHINLEKKLYLKIRIVKNKLHFLYFIYLNSYCLFLCFYYIL